MIDSSARRDLYFLSRPRRLLALRVISLLRSNLVASGVKRTSITEPDLWVHALRAVTHLASRQPIFSPSPYPSGGAFLVRVPGFWPHRFLPISATASPPVESLLFQREYLLRPPCDGPPRRGGGIPPHVCCCRPQWYPPRLPLCRAPRILVQRVGIKPR